jgi:hypothetical protein
MMDPVWGTGGAPGAQTDQMRMLGENAAAFLERIKEAEQRIAVREWWMLGEAIPEARILAELASLLAVARGELEHTIVDHFGRVSLGADVFGAESHTSSDSMPLSDPVWLAERTQEVRSLLRAAAQVLPAYHKYGVALRDHVTALRLPPEAIHSLSIVADRLGEAVETVFEARSGTP